MIKNIFIYGMLSGGIVIGMMITGFVLSDGKGAVTSQLVGYLIMLVALTLVFVGIKRHRDHNLGGIIKFGTAFKMGLGIAAIAGFTYVGIWETYLTLSEFDFIEKYTAGVIESKKAKGLTGAELDALIANMAQLKENYAKPLFRLPMTFLEIFPLAAIIALISAVLLRNEKFMPARS